MAFCEKVKVIPAFLRKSCEYFPKSIGFSTEACASVQDRLPHFKTSENNPCLHTKELVGKYYTINKNLKNKLFFSGGIANALERQMKTFNEACIMIRKPSLEIMSILKRMNFDLPAVRFVIYGKLGTGKTTSLIHLVHYGYMSKYLLLHLPWVSNWTKRPKEVVASQFKEGRIDLPVESTLWLQHFKLQNAELLQELDLKTSKPYTWSKREVTEEGKPIIDIVEHGLVRVRHSSDCVAALLKEIKYHSQFGKFKSLVIVDGVNGFYAHTNVKRPDKSMVPANEITIVNAFLKLLRNDWTNAAVVATVDTLPHNRNASMQDPFTPRVLLGKEGFELLDPFIPIQSDNYSDKEAENVIDYYCERLWLQSEEARGEKGRRQLKFLSGYHPYTLMKLCDPL